ECGREHEAHNINQLQAKFDEIKRKELEGINVQGTGLKKDLGKRDFDITQANDQFEITKSSIIKSIENLKSSLEEVNNRISNAVNNQVVVKSYEERVMEDDSIASKTLKISELQGQLETTPVDYGDLRIRKASINSDLDLEKR